MPANTAWEARLRSRAKHITNNEAVRRTLLTRHSPESLPPAEDVKKVERAHSRQRIKRPSRIRTTSTPSDPKATHGSQHGQETARKKTVEALTHDADKRKNIPTAEYQSVVKQEQQNPIRVAYERRNRDLDPQLVWRGKDEQDWSDLVVHAPPLYIQEKVHPKVLIDDLLRQTEETEKAAGNGRQPDLFADFNGIPEGADKTEFYQHDQNWSNRMILGDSLQVMASLAEREGLRGKVQCIYFDPPYGIKFNSNFQWSHHQPRREGRQRRAHHPRAGAGQGVPRHVARRDPQLSDISPRPAHGRARSAHGVWFDLRADRR